MKEKYRRVVHSIYSVEDEPDDCEGHRDTIPAYVEAELADRDATALYPALAEHLDICPDCWEEYSDLRLILALEQRGELEEPPRPGRFDFSFLRELAPEPVLWTVLEGNVRRLVTTLTAQLGEKVVTLVALPELLAPYHLLATTPGALRTREVRGVAQEGLREIQELPDSKENTLIKLLMGPVQAGKGVIMVQVEEMEPLRPVQWARVSLLDQNKSLLERTSTAFDGIAAFRNLDVGQYIIQVQRNGSRWEIELNLEAGP